MPVLYGAVHVRQSQPPSFIRFPTGVSTLVLYVCVSVSAPGVDSSQAGLSLPPRGHLAAPSPSCAWPLPPNTALSPSCSLRFPTEPGNAFSSSLLWLSLTCSFLYLMHWKCKITCYYFLVFCLSSLLDWASHEARNRISFVFWCTPRTSTVLGTELCTVSVCQFLRNQYIYINSLSELFLLYLSICGFVLNNCNVKNSII